MLWALHLMMHRAQITNDPADVTLAKNSIHKFSGRVYNTMTQLGFHDLPNSVGLIGCYYTIDGL